MMSRICKELEEQGILARKRGLGLDCIEILRGFRGEGMECMFKKRAIIMEKGGLNQTGNPSCGGEKVVFHLL